MDRFQRGRMDGGEMREPLQVDAHKSLTDKIIGGAMCVSNTLGIGFLERVYENALVIELEEMGLAVEQQKSIQVKYKDRVVGDYVADLIVEGVVTIELKSVDAISKAHEAQLLNYLKATGVRVGLILNFGTPRLGIRRLVF